MPLVNRRIPGAETYGLGSPPPGIPGDPPNEPGVLKAMVKSIRTRILSGLLLALPIALTPSGSFTGFIRPSRGSLLIPMGRLTTRIFQDTPPPFWWEGVVAL